LGALGTIDAVGATSEVDSEDDDHAEEQPKANKEKE
jgi:hypothetical protein